MSKNLSSTLPPDIAPFLKVDTLAWPRPLVQAMYLLLGVGVISILYGVFSSNHPRAWAILLVNFLFWSGLAMAGVIISATWRIVGATWAAPFKRIAEGLVSFLPISFLLFLILFLGRNDWIPWLAHPDPHKAPWLNLPFFFLRNAVGLLVLYGMSFYYVYLSVRPDVGAAIELKAADARGLRGWLVRDWTTLDEETQRRDRVLRWFSIALVVAYALVFSLLAFDLVMSLDTRFCSTLFGIYFFVGNLYAGFAAINVWVAFHIRRGNLGALVTPTQLHDQGKLTFAFCMLTGYMLFVQFLVIWYGNLPEEIGFLLRRISERPWRIVSPVMVLAAVVAPLCVLLSRQIKKRPMGLLLMGICILVGMWMERFILVAPSLWHGSALPLGWMELGMTAGFLAASALSYRAFARTFPMIAATDALFAKSRRRHSS